MLASLGAISDQTLLITARHAGQTVVLNGTVAATATTDGQQLRVYGSGDVYLGGGWWDKLGIFDGNYQGDYFDGSMSSTLPTAYFRISSRDVPKHVYAAIERTVYGSEGSPPRMPTVQEIRAFLA